jgi:hypothetical protein
MHQSQLLLSIVPLGAIERPACPKCHAQMMLARIVPAFSGTDLHTFECTLCNHVLKKLGACEDWRGPAAVLTMTRGTLSILAADPFTPDGQQRRHDHGTEEKAKQSERLHSADNSDQHQQEW